MAGKLVQVATNTVSSATASVTLTGIDSDDVYMVAVNNVTFSADKVIYIRFTESGTPNSTSNYDRAGKGLRTTSAFYNNSATNANVGYFSPSRLEAGTGANAILYIYNANDSSKYTFMTNETVDFRESAQGLDVEGFQGGQVLTVTSAVDGVEFTLESAENFLTGTFTLYKVV
jgi:hypothetical protein|tara:strand:+ start:195 stop:713 length:519 start_codon:yes stop_codon:yes gene_type:complete